MKSHAVIVLTHNDKVLFVQRAATKKSLPNMWAFPSGTMEDGETPEMTVVREAREELQIDVVARDKFAIIELPELGAQLHFVRCATETPDAIVCDPGEIQAMRWLTFEAFFAEYTDEQIGHGLIALRKQPALWEMSCV